jgi:hypothetical protein
MAFNQWREWNGGSFGVTMSLGVLYHRINVTVKVIVSTETSIPS